MNMQYSVLLHNIRSAHNVGSIFRTADAAGFSHVYLSGYTPLPIDRFGRKRADIDKVALGAQEILSWSEVKDIEMFLRSHYVVAVEQDERSIPYDSFEAPKEVHELILMMGEETKGIEKELLVDVSSIIEIPMRGEKESLNVSVAFAVVAYEITKNHLRKSS